MNTAFAALICRDNTKKNYYNSEIIPILLEYEFLK